MNKAVFLDRDGVIVRDDSGYYISKLEDFALYQEVPEALKALSKEYKLIVVTNQGAIAKGLYTMKQYKAFSDLMEAELLKSGVKLDGIYFCPHHISVSECECRKPKPGMILRAAKEHSIDLKNSWLIGDKISDIIAGQTAGCRTILVKTGAGKKDESYLSAVPDFVANNLMEARLIIQNSK